MGKRFITKVFLLATMLAITLSINPIRQLLEEKAKMDKLSTDGKSVVPVLRAHGTGITDGQETLVQNFIDQAEQRYGADSYQNALYIQQKVEDAFSGRWIVEIFGGDPSWGRATHIRDDMWILYFGYGSYSWDYIIWTPEC